MTFPSLNKPSGLLPAIILAAILSVAAACNSSPSPSAESPPAAAATAPASPTATPALQPTSPPATTSPTSTPQPKPTMSATMSATVAASINPESESAHPEPDDTLTYDEPDYGDEPGKYDDNPELEAAEQPAEQPQEESSNGLPSCGTKLDCFTHSPVALTDFMGITPVGNLGPPGHTFPTDHVFFHINRIDIQQWELGTVSVPVVSPGDIWITAFTVTENLSNDPPSTDYGLTFTPCGEITGFMLHLLTLSDKLLAGVGTDFDRCDEYSIDGAGEFRYCEKKGLRIQVSAGEVIGTAGGNQFANAFNLGIYDLRTPALPYANQSRWPDRSLHNACPLDYFVTEVCQALQQRLGTHDNTGLRTIEPFCGEVEQDEPGAAGGVWFAEGTEYTYPEEPHLALVRDNLDPSISVFSVGTGIGASGLDTGLYYFTPLADGLINRAFRDVIPGEVYCYENLTLKFGEPAGVTIILEMPTATTLRIQRITTLCATGPWTLTDLATTFQR